jgi:hypothetical protein
LGTVAGTVVTILINGVVIAQTILRPKGEEVEEGEEEGERTEYTLDIRVQDQDQVQRTNLATDEKDLLWVYGQVRCNKPEIDTASMTEAMSFAKRGPNASWLVMGKARMRDGFKAVPVRARPPNPEALLAGENATILISVPIEDQRVSGPVELQLEHYIMEFLPPEA